MPEPCATCPPIPPNCDQFVYVDGQWVFSAVGGFPAESKLWENGNWPWPLNNVQPYQRPIIAGVARSAWMDIETQVAELSEKAHGRPFTEEESVFVRANLGAEYYAETWRKWGAE